MRTPTEKEVGKIRAAQRRMVGLQREYTRLELDIAEQLDHLRAICGAPEYAVLEIDGTNRRWVRIDPATKQPVAIG